MNDFFVFLENIEVYRYEFGKQPIFIGKKLIEMQNAIPVVNGNVLYLLQVGLNYKNTIYQTLKTIEGSPNCDIVFTRSSRV